MPDLAGHTFALFGRCGWLPSLKLQQCETEMNSQDEERRPQNSLGDGTADTAARIFWRCAEEVGDRRNTSRTREQLSCHPLPSDEHELFRTEQ
jgi:hypothetical protein